MAEEVDGENFSAEPIEIGDDDSSSGEYYAHDEHEDPDGDSSDDESASESSGRNSPQYGSHYAKPHLFM